MALAAEPQGVLQVSLSPADLAGDKPWALAVDQVGEGQPSPYLPWRWVEGREVTLSLPAGRYRVRCAAEGAVGGASQAVRVVAGGRAAAVCRLQPAVPVSGQVVEAVSGGPLVGAWVGIPLALPSRCEEEGQERIPCELAARTASAQTQEDGRFTVGLLPGAQQTLLALAEGYGPAWARLQPGEQQAVRLALSSSGVVEVALQGEAETLPGSCLWLQPVFAQLAREEKELYRWLWRRAPEETGWVRFPAVPPGLWRLLWAPQPCPTVREPAGTVSTLLHVVAGGSVLASLDTRVRSVAVRLRFPREAQLLGAEVSLWWRCQQGSGLQTLGRLGPEGQADGQLALPVGRCDLWTGLQGEGFVVDLPLEPVVVAARGPVAVDQKVELGTLVGRVFGPDGEPRAVLVAFQDLSQHRSSGSCQAQADGLFRCPVPASGRYRFEASAPAEGLYGAAELSLPAGDLQLRLLLRSELRGRVVDADGQPVANAWVRFARLKLTEHGFPLRQPGVRTDNEGSFRLQGLPEEEGVLTAVAGGLLGALRFGSPSGIEPSLQLTLQPMGAVWLAPLPGACTWLAAESSEGWLPPVALAALNGVLTASSLAPSQLRLPPGTYRLLCHDEEGKQVARTARFVVQEGQVLAQPPWQ